ncbi:MAG: DUF362 domain-containing protein [Eggerthellaceae bacterium]
MPNLVDIVEVAEALESKAVYLASDRCVVVRNRHASCAKCADACPTGSVFAANNVLELDGEGCVACGACTTVCPVEALIPTARWTGTSPPAWRPPWRQPARPCSHARIASKRGRPGEVRQVPCLARMEESVLLGLAARGVEDIVLVDGVRRCKFLERAGHRATLASANELMAAQGSDVCVRRASAFPDEVLLEDKHAAGRVAPRLLHQRAHAGERTPRARRPGDGVQERQRRRRCASDCACPTLARCRSSTRSDACWCWMRWTGWARRRFRDRHAAVRLGIHRHEACSSCNSARCSARRARCAKASWCLRRGGQLPGVLGGRLRAVQPVRRRVLERAA